ncbi:STEROID 5-ALPHA-REDUCTASE DET2 [Salix koriyanagi]|uniref:STEROID 5-ALPHA-REDUCTASE DET2 n=1 Tax=Salix koriyanagi TaxID=2511006 RepID=A0A9Q0W027_9ROSI|nr:STEROID 5-ALPHA-REDUCTASE DET2 [Salix koriyanagi]
MAPFLEQTFFHYALLSFYLLGPPTFIALRFFQFPYGKHNRVNTSKIPKLYFSCLLFSSITSTAPSSTRFAFTRVPLKQNTKTTIGFPLFLSVNGFLTQALNTYLQVRWVSHYKSDYDSDGGLFWWKFFGGLVVFLWGMRINMWADTALLVLKSENGGYKVPRGGWFEVVTCPNYLGEIVEWLGWAVMTWSWGGLGFFLYTCSNLVPRACASHKWYLEKFGEDYPKNRKAVIPFIV